MLRTVHVIAHVTYEIENRLVRLWCDNTLGESWENTREACKTRGVAECIITP
jgi:hypothetical protein